MSSSARLGGRRALIAVVLAVGGLLTTGAATLAQPLLEAHTSSDADDDAERALRERRAHERRIIAATLGEVRPATDPIAQLTQEAPRTFAGYDGITLVEPAADVLSIGFHQAGGSHPALTPMGELVANENPYGTDHVEHVAGGAAIRVMPSRGRGGSGTSAADVALAPGTVVRSVVTGTVTAVEDYTLYGSHRDVFVEIQPEGRPDVRVVLYHLDDVVVGVGDPVFAGLTPIAGGARDLPVTNQIDRYAESCPCPHVDIRLRLV